MTQAASEGWCIHNVMRAYQPQTLNPKTLNPETLNPKLPRRRFCGGRALELDARDKGLPEPISKRLGGVPFLGVS